MLGAGADSFPEASSYFSPVAEYRTSTDKYLETIGAARQAVDIPIIASLNGATEAGWIDYARLLQQAGASAIELNVFFVPADPTLTAGRGGGALPRRAARRARRREHSGGGQAQPVFHCAGRPGATAGAGRGGRIRAVQPLLPARHRSRGDEPATRPRPQHAGRDPAAAAVDRHPVGRLRASLAASTGVESADQVIKYLLVGADVVMTTSALLRHGPAHMRVLLTGLEQWLEAPRRQPGGHPRPDEPVEHSRPGGVRAGQLHPHPAKLARLSAVTRPRPASAASPTP